MCELGSHDDTTKVRFVHCTTSISHQTRWHTQKQKLNYSVKTIYDLNI